MHKLGQQSIDNRSMETDPSISHPERIVICPCDKISHNVVIQTLPICFAILQFLPGVKESKEFSGMFGNKTPPLPAKNIEDESIRKEFKLVFKKATEEYK